MSVKRLPPQEQLRIVLEGLRGDVKLSELCRRENIYPNEYYPKDPSTGSVWIWIG